MVLKQSVCILALLGALTACQRKDPPAPVVQLGLNVDSPAGATMVREGDTLWNISKRYRLPLRDIIDLNKLSPPYVLNTGQRIKLPAPRNYNVQYGDTLYGISRVFGVDTHGVVRLNGLSKPYTLQVNQVLRIPSHDNKRPGVQYGTDMPDYVARPQSKPSGSVAQSAKKSSTTGRGSASSPSARAGQFGWPVDGVVLSSYGPKKDGIHNDGINIAAPRGAPVRAAERGTVVYVGDDLKSFGNLVLVRHDGGWMTAYAHLERISVKKGQNLSTRDVLGTVGSTGTVDKPQLHFEVRKGGNALNPQKYLSSRV